MTFSPIKFMASGFTPDIELGNILKYATAIVDASGIELDGDLNILPIPSDAPPEIPRIQLASIDKKWRVNVSLERTIISFVEYPFGDKIGIDSAAFCVVAAELYSSMVDKLKKNIQRLAFVNELAFQIDSPVVTLSTKLIKDAYIGEGGLFKIGKKLEIHTFDRVDWSPFSLNSWIRLKTASITDNSQAEEILLLELDLNTLAKDQDPDKIFSTREIKQFYNDISGYGNSIIDTIGKLLGN